MILKTQSEHQIQVNLMKWCELMRHTYPELSLMFAIPNGGLRNKIVASKLKAEGARAGVPDLFLPSPKGEYHGLFIEMKSLKGVTRPNQREWLAKLGKQGYACVVCKGYDAAVEAIEEYLKL